MLILKIIDFCLIHAKCPTCEQIGHKQNMTERYFGSGCVAIGGAFRKFYHHKCREETFKERLCECKQNWILKDMK